MKFSSFNLKKELLENLEKKGYINCKPIQEITLKASLRKESFIAKAETGSGKTHAYIVPLINNLNYSLNKIQAIILEPTIELTMQVGEFLKELVSNTLNFYPCILTGSNVLFDEKSLTRPSILVTTPGKLVQLLKNNSLSLKFIFSMVLDECDMLFEGDSKEDMNFIFSNFEPEQLMIFTATMKDHLIASIKKTYHLNQYVYLEDSPLWIAVINSEGMLRSLGEDCPSAFSYRFRMASGNLGLQYLKRKI